MITVEWIILVLFFIWAYCFLFKPTPPTPKSCLVCGGVPIPDRLVCPECRYPAPEDAPDPFASDLSRKAWLERTSVERAELMQRINSTLEAKDFGGVRSFLIQQDEE